MSKWPAKIWAGLRDFGFLPRGTIIAGVLVAAFAGAGFAHNHDWTGNIALLIGSFLVAAGCDAEAKRKYAEGVLRTLETVCGSDTTITITRGQTDGG